MRRAALLALIILSPAASHAAACLYGPAECDEIVGFLEARDHVVTKVDVETVIGPIMTAQYEAEQAGTCVTFAQVAEGALETDTLSINTIGVIFTEMGSSASETRAGKLKLVARDDGPRYCSFQTWREIF